MSAVIWSHCGVCQAHTDHDVIKGRCVCRGCKRVNKHARIAVRIYNADDNRRRETIRVQNAQ